MRMLCIANRSLTLMTGRLGRPALLVVNKSEGEPRELMPDDIKMMGLGQPIYISAAHNEVILNQLLASVRTCVYIRMNGLAYQYSHVFYLILVLFQSLFLLLTVSMSSSWFLPSLPPVLPSGVLKGMSDLAAMMRPVSWSRKAHDGLHRMYGWALKEGEEDLDATDRWCGVLQFACAVLPQSSQEALRLFLGREYCEV